MSEDADHEVIASPQALFRHLYEAHHLQEARDLDPYTAPLQFWIRRHNELERAARLGARGRDGEDEAAGTQGPPPADQRRPQPPERRRPQPPDQRRAQPPDQRRPQAPDQRRPQAPDQRRAQAPERRRAPPQGDRQARNGAAGFEDPLVEALVMALVGRGHDERRVRGFVRSYVTPDGAQTGAAGVRAWFAGPVLDAIAERLSAGPAARAGPATRPGTGGRSPAPDDDVMAIADLLQGRRGDGPGHDSRPGRAPRPDDDVMAIADILQRRRTGHGST